MGSSKGGVGYEPFFFFFFFFLKSIIIIIIIIIIFILKIDRQAEQDKDRQDRVEI